MARILVADDDAHIVRVMSIWLTRHGHEVLAVRDGKEALDLLTATPVDLIISDMNMPELDGIGFVKAVREKLRRQLPIMLLTARCDQEKLGQVLEGYNVRIYSKPFLPSQIVSEINELLLPASASTDSP